MATKEGEGVDLFLFGVEGQELVDLKCFRGDRDDISEGDIRAQLHDAIMQQKLRRAAVSKDAPTPNVERVFARDFVACLGKTC